MTTNEFTVIRDTKEKTGHGWIFEPSGRCLGTDRYKMKTGDYTLRGYEHILSIERKGSISEFAQNINQDRFERELERLEEFEQPFIILEFDMDDIVRYPDSARLPPRVRKKIRFKGKYYMKRLFDFQFKYKTKIILAGKHGYDTAMSIFYRTVENYEPNPYEEEAAVSED